MPQIISADFDLGSLCPAVIAVDGVGDDELEYVAGLGVVKKAPARRVATKGPRKPIARKPGTKPPARKPGTKPPARKPGARPMVRKPLPTKGPASIKPLVPVAKLKTGATPTAQAVIVPKPIAAAIKSPTPSTVRTALTVVTANVPKPPSPSASPSAPASKPSVTVPPKPKGKSKGKKSEGAKTADAASGRRWGLWALGAAGIGGAAWWFLRRRKRA